MSGSVNVTDGSHKSDVHLPEEQLVVLHDGGHRLEADGGAGVPHPGHSLDTGYHRGGSTGGYEG